MSSNFSEIQKKNVVKEIFFNHANFQDGGALPYCPTYGIYFGIFLNFEGMIFTCLVFTNLPFFIFLTWERKGRMEHSSASAHGPIQKLYMPIILVTLLSHFLVMQQTMLLWLSCPCILKLYFYCPKSRFRYRYGI